MEWAAFIRVIKSALFAFSLLLFTSVLADVTIVAPKDGATVTLMKAEQQAYLAQPKNARWAQMADSAVRAKYMACDSRPATVTLAWQDSAFDAQAVYAIELKRAGSDKTERFEVKGVTKAPLVNLESGRTYAWKVSRQGGEASKPTVFKTAEGPRLMRIPGVANCRDLGGRAGFGGRRMRQGRVYRTAAYNGASKRVGDSLLDARFVTGPMRITPSGRRELVEACGVKTDLDLRNETECAGMTGSPLGASVAWVHVPIRAYAWIDNDKVAMGKILKLFADEKNYPIAFHCAGGRDRAGSLAFVLEGLCGVAEDELLKDWEFSLFATDDANFAPTRIEGLVEMLSHYSGATIHARIESFVKACGVSEDEIAAIRRNLLEK